MSTITTDTYNGINMALYLNNNLESIISENIWDAGVDCWSNTRAW